MQAQRKAGNRNYIWLGIGLLIALGLAAWLVPSWMASAAPSDLEGKMWKLSSINGQLPVPGSSVTISFDHGKVAGSSGVNQFGGTYRVSGSTITLSEISSTLMASADPALNAQEQIVMGALQGQLTYYVSANQLQISAGATTLIFSA